MSIVRRERKPLQPVSVKWAWHRKPIWPCAILEGGADGLLEINGVLYDVLPLVPGGYRLGNHANGEVHYVDTIREPWVCTCGDFVFRRNGSGPDTHHCKHLQSLIEALASLWSEEPIPPTVGAVPAHLYALASL